MSNILQIKDLMVSYGGINAVKGISLDVPEGKIVTLIGANGAGKSTFVRMIAGDHTPDSGELYFNGKLLKTFSPGEMEKLGIRIIYQEFNLVGSMSVAENIFLGNRVLNRELFLTFRRLGVELPYTQIDVHSK